jgi:serpin B
MNTYTLKTIIFATVISIILAACSPSISLSMAKSNIRRETNPTLDGNTISDLVDGNNTFAFDIYNSLRSENGNLVLSPYSISQALAMTYAGAHSDTESQMAQTLHFSSQDRLHSSFNALDLALQNTPANLNKDQEPMKLNITNAVWSEQTIPFQQEFLDTIALNYGAGVHLADFINQPEPSRKSINDWVSDQTHDKINDLLPKDSIGTDTRMVLVNAIYFKADWLTQFEAKSTGDAPFDLIDGTQVKVKMMHEGLFDVPYVQGNGYQAVELAYAGKTTAMDIILPDAGNFQPFESSLNKPKLDEILNGMQPASVTLGLPKFEFTREFGLTDALTSLGMHNAFDGDLADFSGMTGKKDLYIGNVVHKAFVAVDEKGTEAAAATAVIMETATAIMHEINLQVNRPFIFIIRDTVNGQILFIGRMMNPAG